MSILWVIYLKYTVILQSKITKKKFLPRFLYSSAAFLMVFVEFHSMYSKWTGLIKEKRKKRRNDEKQNSEWSEKYLFSRRLWRISLNFCPRRKHIHIYFIFSEKFDQVKMKKKRINAIASRRMPYQFAQREEKTNIQVWIWENDDT